MNDVLLIVSYDGTRFFGWQKTKTGPSIEEELEKAVARILRTSIKLEAASRTDRGVHAKGQAVQFRTEKPIAPKKFRRSLNAVLPVEISVQEVIITHEGFHPTLDATLKEYHYFLCNTPVQIPIHRLYSWHIYQPLNIEMMRKASLDLIGSHDFTAFTNEPQLDNIRTMEKIEIVPMNDGRLCIEIRGDRFLYKMARNIVGTLVDVGLGKISSNAIEKILASKKRENAGVSAPAHGLFLMKVFYSSPTLPKIVS